MPRGEAVPTEACYEINAPLLFYQSAQTEALVGFTKENLSGIQLVGFIPAIAKAWALEGMSFGSALVAALKGSMQLGLHTGVVVKRFTVDQANKLVFRANLYLYSAPATRPNGATLPLQCKACHSLYAFDPARKASRNDMKKRFKAEASALKEDEHLYVYDCGECSAVACYAARTPLSTIPCGKEDAWLLFNEA